MDPINHHTELSPCPHQVASSHTVPTALLSPPTLSPHQVPMGFLKPTQSRWEPHLGCHRPAAAKGEPEELGGLPSLWQSPNAADPLLPGMRTVGTRLCCPKASLVARLLPTLHSLRIWRRKPTKCLELSPPPPVSNPVSGPMPGHGCDPSGSVGRTRSGLSALPQAAGHPGRRSQLVLSSRHCSRPRALAPPSSRVPVPPARFKRILFTFYIKHSLSHCSWQVWCLPLTTPPTQQPLPPSVALYPLTQTSGASQVHGQEQWV